MDFVNTKVKDALVKVLKERVVQWVYLIDGLGKTWN